MLSTTLWRTRSWWCGRGLETWFTSGPEGGYDGVGRRLLLRVQRKTRRQLQRNQVLSLRSLLLSNVVIRRIVSLFQVRLSLSRRLSRCVEVVRICKDDRRATAREARANERKELRDVRRRHDHHDHRTADETVYHYTCWRRDRAAS